MMALVACSAVQENPEPLKNLQYERTSRLVEMHQALAEKNAAYLANKGDRLDRNTNNRKFGELKDEYARWDMRAQAQIERELVRRHREGDANAVFPGMESQLVPTPPTPSSPSP